MIPIPAIDLRDGQVVRLLHGDFDKQTVYFSNAAEVAARFEQDGAARLHVVDLDGALKGEPKNLRSVEAILNGVKIPVELGGGIRKPETVRFYLNLGVSWVVLGTKACLDRGFLKETLKEFGERVIVGIDARDGFVATDGWTKVTQTRATAMAADAEKLGAKTIIYTDISKDGALMGPNVDSIRGLTASSKADIIASGGVGSLADLEKLMTIKAPNLIGAIIGKALYENRLSLKDAVKTCLQNA